MKRAHLPLIFFLSLNALSVSATVHTIEARNFFYSPASLTTNLGDTIRFVWIAGTHPTQSSTGAWTTFTLSSTNPTYNFVPTSAGTYPYICTIHTGLGMVGSITVNSTTPPCGPTSPPTGLNTVSGTTSAVVSWNVLPNTQLYQVQGRPQGSTTFRKRNTTGTSVNIPGLTPATTYEWQVRALCQITDITTIWSPLATFITNTLREPADLSTSRLAWQIQGSELTWQWTGDAADLLTSGSGLTRLVDLLGRTVRENRWNPMEGSPAGRINLDGITGGMYFLLLENQDQRVSIPVYLLLP